MFESYTDKVTMATGVCSMVQAETTEKPTLSDIFERNKKKKTV